MRIRNEPRSHAKPEHDAQRFLPTTFEEGKNYYADFSGFDVIFVTGDPYYDHPLNGTAIIARLLDRMGYKVAVLPQPETDEEFKACGEPKYLFCISSGLLDSSLANYTPMLKKREGVRVPERALMTYTSKIKQHFKGKATILGGVEATIRRFTHFDYKDNALRRGILNDSKADILIFGNGERALLTLLSRFDTTKKFKDQREALELHTIDGIAFRIKKNESTHGAKPLPSFEQCVMDDEKFSTAERAIWLHPDSAFVEPCGEGRILHTRRSHTLCEEEMDFIYLSPFTRSLHPDAKDHDMNKRMTNMLATSVPIGRGCWGSCSFCIIPLVQGKEVARRSIKSIVNEIEALYAQGAQKINDLTLPTLNMYGSRCSLYDQAEEIYSPLLNKNITVYNKVKHCNQMCVGCEYREISDDLFPLLVEIEALQQKYKGKELELRSAIRHDIILDQEKLFRKMMQFITRLKIAPEHISNKVLAQMNKATRADFEKFLALYKKVNMEQGTSKNLVPYIVAAHPGCEKEDMQEMKQFCEDNSIFINLTQVFTPTPGTLSTAMYHTGTNPLTRKTVHVPRAFREKKDQKNILFASDDEIHDDNA